MTRCICKIHIKHPHTKCINYTTPVLNDIQHPERHSGTFTDWLDGTCSAYITYLFTGFHSDRKCIAASQRWFPCKLSGASFVSAWLITTLCRCIDLKCKTVQHRKWACELHMSHSIYWNTEERVRHSVRHTHKSSKSDITKIEIGIWQGNSIPAPMAGWLARLGLSRLRWVAERHFLSSLI